MPQDINIIIKNCNNIDQATIGLDSDKLNIKYGINGTGKSTIARAIELAINEKGSLNELLPFKCRKNSDAEKQPAVEGVGNITSVKVFNETYVNQFLFTQDEVVKNSFEIFIKTSEYDKKMLEIDSLVSGIKNTFKDDEKLERVTHDLSELSSSFGKTSGIHGSGKLAKAISKGNPLENIPDRLVPYKSFLTMSDNRNVQWLGWHNKGEDFLEVSNDCPYCTAPSEEKKETIRSVKQEYNPKNIEHLNDIIKIIDGLGEYFSPDTKLKLQEIIKNKGNISEEQKIYLEGIRPNIETLKTKLSSLKEISFFSFKGSDKAQERINEFKIDLSYLPHLQSDAAKEIVARVNQALKGVESKIGELQGQIAQQKRGIENTISKHKTEINDFLKYAGYSYQVDILEQENTYKMLLCHREHDGHIEHSSKYLSYGERNAFALVLFMYQCLSEKPDLIILDDPISSFDKNKKYAITSKLFRGKDSFHQKTVLMVTHDLEPIIDIVHTFHRDFHQFSSASFLENTRGNVSEISINKQDIKSFGKVCTDNIARGQDAIVRAIYLRRYYEILNHHGNEYHVLSSLLKKRPAPSLDANGQSIMPQNDVDAAIAAIKKDHIPDFDYDAIITNLNDDHLSQLYQSASNNYEKLQLYRIIMQGKNQDDLHENDVVRKFINEAFHIENEYVAQLDPSKYSLVPQYIIDECDQALDIKTQNRAA